VAEDAVTGVAALERTLEGIDKITQSSTAVSDAIESLGARIQNIGSILEVILEVATQTKLLALNAAILAAQAGEHGRGFGILADQIKGLAARTNASVSEIADLITNIQTESDKALATMREGSTYVEEGVRLGNETAEVLRAIEKSANSASSMVQQITDATVEQSRSTKRVLASVDTIAVTVQEVNRAAGEQAAGSEQIVASTSQMKSSTEVVRRSSSEQTNATQGIAMSVATIHDMAAQLARAQSEQTGTANNTLATVEAIKTVADGQLQAVSRLETAIGKLREHSDKLRATISQFRV
jgi:methyl-accepting chemotaxis protein